MNSFEKRPKDGYGFIYKYTSPSGKSYIGQTVFSLKERAGYGNGSGYKTCTIFYQAIQKYGIKNLQVEILGEFPKEELDEKETYFIHLYNTLMPNGYNMIDGAANNQLGAIARRKKIKKYDLNGNLIKIYNSVQEAANDNNAFYQMISACLRKEKPQYKNYIYRYYDDDPPKPYKKPKNKGRKTAQYDLDGNLIAIYPSACQAALAIGKSKNAGRNIRFVCDGQRLTAYGFKWKYLD